MNKIKIDIFLANLLLFSLPLIYYPGYGSYNSLRYFFFGTIVLTLFIFTIYRFLKNKWLLKLFFKSWYSYGLIAYLLSFILVSITSVNPALSFFSSFSRTDGAFVILFLTLFSLSIYSILSLSTDKNKIIKQLLTSSILGAVVLSLLAIFSPEGFSILNWDWLVKSGGGGTTGNQSVAGSYLIWNIFFVVILFFKSCSFNKKILPFFYFLILAFSPLFLNWNLFSGKIKYSDLTSFVGLARGSLLGVVFGFILTLGIWFLLQKNKIKKYIGIGVTSIILLGTIFCGISFLQKSSSLHQKFVEYTNENRFTFWNNAIKGFKERPLLGWGSNTFSYPFHKFFEPKMLLKENNYEVMVSKAHNIFFETLVNGGILLILVLLFFIASIILGLIKLAKRNKLSILEISLFIGALSGWLLQAQFVFDSILSLLMLFLICGILYGCLVDKQENIKQKISYFTQKDKFIIFLGVSLIIALFVYTIALPYKKNRVMYKTYESKLPARIDLWKNFTGISPMGDSLDSVWMFDNLYKTYYKKRHDIQAWDVQKKDIILKELDEITSYLSGLTDHSKDYDLFLITAKIYYLRMYIAKDVSEHELNKTQELIAKAMSLSLTDPQPYWLKAQLETANGDFLEAKKTLEKALTFESRIPYTHALILELAKKMNDKNYYDFALKRAEESIPNIIRKIDELKELDNN